MARPTKLTTEVEETILKAIRSGNYAGTAATYAGVDRSTYFRWLERGDPAGTAPTDGRYRAFRARVEQAKAEAEVRDITMIAKAGERDWRARAWSVERRHPERWARRAAAEEERSSLERALAAAGTSYRLAALSEPEQNDLARLLDRARVDNPANKGGSVPLAELRGDLGATGSAAPRKESKAIPPVGEPGPRAHPYSARPLRGGPPGAP